MKVLLLYPEMPSSFWSMDHTLHILGKSAWYPPLGLLTVASMLPLNWEQRLIDLNVDPLSDADIQWADYVLVSAMNVQEESARKLIQKCNRLQVPVVAGGSLFTLEHDRFEGVSHFILNEAEITLPPFLEDLKNGKAKPLYQAEGYADTQSTPQPAWQHVDLNRYQYGIMQYSRGCPFHCDFCDVPVLYGNNPRTKTVEQTLAELNVFHAESKVPGVLFADDNLIGNKRILKNELLPALIKWREENVPIFSFSTQVSINLADDAELMDMMLEAGFRHLFIGIETDAEETLKLTGKSQNLRRDVLDNIRTLHEKGFIVVGGFIVGFDTDTIDTFQTQLNLIQESGILLATVNMLKAPPGTPLYERMQKENRLISGFSFGESETNFIPKMPTDVLYKEFDALIQNVYGPEPGVQRAKKWLHEFNHLPDVVTDIPALNTIEYLPVLFRAIYHIGIRWSGRKHFWQLMGWTLRHHLRKLDWALVDLIFIYQLHLLMQGYSKSIQSQIADMEKTAQKNESR